MSGISTASLRSNRLDNELGITKSSRHVAWSAARRYDRLITSVAAVFLRPWQSPLCSFCPRRYESSQFSAASRIQNRDAIEFEKHQRGRKRGVSRTQWHHDSGSERPLKTV